MIPEEGRIYRVFKKHETQVVFPSLFKLVKIYTLPVSAAAVERFFADKYHQSRADCVSVNNKIAAVYSI